MQQKLREEILSVPQRNLEGQIQNQTFLQKIFSREMQALQDWISHIDEELLDKTVEASSECRSYSGNRSTLFLSAANWFGNRLNLLLGNTHIIQEFYDPRFDLLNHITDKTVVISIAFARYTKWTYRYADSAKKMGAALVSITDSDFLSFF